MKILHVLTAPRAEGTPRLVLDWLSVRGHEQELLFLSPDGNLRSNFHETRVWQYYNDEFKLGFKAIPRLMRLVRRICLQRRPDLVISWTFGLSHWITIGARGAGVRNILAHCGNPPGEGFMKKYFHSYLCVYLGMLFKNKVVACSNFVRDEYGRLLPTGFRNFHVVYNAFSIDKFLIPPGFDRRTKREVSMVGYLEAARDHKTLLNAWRRIEHEVGDIKLNIIGDGALREELEAMARNLLLERVNFTGRIDNVQQFLWRTRVYVFSTLREGFGLTLLEALAAGCSVVATDVPACREVLDNGTYGTLVPVRNDQRLATAILEKLNATPDDKDVKNQIAYASRFTPRIMMDRYLEISGLNGNK